LARVLRLRLPRLGDITTGNQRICGPPQLSRQLIDWQVFGQSILVEPEADSLILAADLLDVSADDAP